MSWYPWSVSDDMVCFVEDQLDYYQVEKPENRIIDEVCFTVMDFVSSRDYFPPSAEDATRRYEVPRLTQFEDVSLLRPLEEKLGIRGIQIDLAIWAALLFCWSDKGDEHVRWKKLQDSRALA